MKTTTELENKLLLTVEFLWNLLDNIDTAGDIAKSDDKLYRKIASGEQRKRYQTGITCDGYTLDFSNLKVIADRDNSIENLLWQYKYDKPPLDQNKNG